MTSPEIPNPVPGCPGLSIDPAGLATWGAQRYDLNPDDPYRHGHCVMRRHYHPPVDHLEVLTATPEVLVAAEALHSVATNQAHLAISLASPTPELQAEVEADLTVRRFGDSTIDTTRYHQLYPGRSWLPPYLRPDHKAHQCNAIDVCWHDWLLRIEGINQTVIYRIGAHRTELNCWEGQWPD